LTEYATLAEPISCLLSNGFATVKLPDNARKRMIREECIISEVDINVFSRKVVL
jgi:hypothetical protein